MDARAKKPKRMYPPIYLALSILLMIGLNRFAPLKQLLLSPDRYFGIILMVVGLVVVLWVRVMFHRAGTTIKPFEESSTLVIDGPFRITRNPVYVGMTLFLVGLGLLLGSLLPFFVIPVFVIVIDRCFIRVEEKMLEETFGQQFGDYASRVRRWL